MPLRDLSDQLLLEKYTIPITRLFETLFLAAYRVNWLGRWLKRFQNMFISGPWRWASYASYYAWLLHGCWRSEIRSSCYMRGTYYVFWNFIFLYELNTYYLHYYLDKIAHMYFTGAITINNKHFPKCRLLILPKEK